MEKSDLIGQLDYTKSNFILCLAAISLFEDEKSYPLLESNSLKLGDKTIEFDQVANIMKDVNFRSIACDEYLKIGLRAFIKESFELIKDYTDMTGQMPSMSSQDWYQFARMIRNCLSYYFMFQFRDYDKRLFPIIWNDKTIDISLDDSPLDLSFFGTEEALTLFDDMMDFVMNTLD